jgi:hypothetical protein
LLFERDERFKTVRFQQAHHLLSVVSMRHFQTVCAGSEAKTPDFSIVNPLLSNPLAGFSTADFAREKKSSNCGIAVANQPKIQEPVART